jgi:hypothetical protein
MDVITELYRHFDQEGRLLYVGISFNSRNRWFEHRTNGAEWPDLSVRMDIERFPSRLEAMAAERKAIVEEKPIYNKMLVPREPAINATKKYTRDPLIRTPVLQAYDKVMGRIDEIHFEKHGRTHGARAWLAHQLGTSRQTLDNWGKRVGFPERHIKKISKITGLTSQEVRPETVMVQMPVEIWKEICESLPDLAARCTVLSDGRNR